MNRAGFSGSGSDPSLRRVLGLQPSLGLVLVMLPLTRHIRNKIKNFKIPKSEKFQIMPRGSGPFASFRAQFSLGRGEEHVQSLAGRDGILWCGSRLLPTNSGVKTENIKKGLQRKILSLVLSFTHVFRPGSRLYSRLGEHKQYSGGYRLQNTLRWHRACYFLLGTILAWGNRFLACREESGAQAVI